MSGNIIIKRERTGRGWVTDANASKAHVTVMGVKLTVHEFDVWEGGDGTPEGQCYDRITWIEDPEFYWPKVKGL